MKICTKRLEKIGELSKKNNYDDWKYSNLDCIIEGGRRTRNY